MSTFFVQGQGYENLTFKFFNEIQNIYAYIYILEIFIHQFQ